MKKTISVLVALVLSTMLTAVAFAKGIMLEYDGAIHEYKGNIYRLLVNDEEIKTPLEPIIFNDRALVPVREVFEATGAKVDYKSKTKEIYITGEDVELVMQIGKEEVTVNGKEKTFLDGVVPKLIAKKGESAKTMVPARFISETLGYDVEFEDGEINIKTEKKRVLLTDVYCKQAGNKVMITIKADSGIEEVSKPILTETGVLYFDIFDAKSKLPNNIEVDKGAVMAVRMGIHEEYIRIAVDTEELISHTLKLSEDKKIIMLTTEKRAEENKDKEKEKIVVIDPGHGGSDGGADREWEDGKVKEKDLNLAVAKKTVKILEDNGVKVAMTRSEDKTVSLNERPEFANNLDAALFVSIHTNSVDGASSANGIEVFYAPTNNTDDYGIKSRELAEKMLKAMISYTGANNRKVKVESHLVTRKSNMPAALIEIGFITNDKELTNLLDEEYQYKLASGIAEGIMKCLPDVTIPEKDDVVLGEKDLGEKIS